MSDLNNKFHDFSLRSSLFKGHKDWYLAFLKSEKIAHVLAVLAQHAPKDSAETFVLLEVAAGALPVTIVDLAAGEATPEVALAEVFSLLSRLRLAHTKGLFSKETAAILIEEYEALAQKIDVGTRASPFVAAEDFTIPTTLQAGPLTLGETISDIGNYKGHIKASIQPTEQKIQQKPGQRSSVILDFIKEKQSVSIKDITHYNHPLIRGCSEKTIQRELVNLIQQGLIEKVGERRWSQYRPI
jgi:hypothetical protein